MQIELKPIQQEVGITFVYVTHDQEEALTMSDRMAVFNRGRIEQVGRPAEVYEHPSSEFIAGFVGVSNMIERDGRRITVRPEKIHILGEGEAPEPGAHVEDGRSRRRVRRADDPVPRRARRGWRADRASRRTSRRPRPRAGATGTAGAAAVAAGAGGHNREGEELDDGTRKRIALRAALTLLVGARVVAAGCGGDDERLAATQPRGPRRSLEEIQAQAGEGEVNLVNWAGYVEDGSTTRRSTGSPRSRRRPAARSTSRSATARTRW